MTWKECWKSAVILRFRLWSASINTILMKRILSKIENYCRDEKIEVAARIPFDNVVTEAMIKGVPVVEFSDGQVSQEIEKLWDRIGQRLKD